MITRIVAAIGDRLFLMRAGVHYGVGIVLEARDRLFMGHDVSVGDGVRIRSRCDTALIRIGNLVRLREFSEINAKIAPVTIEDYCFIAKGAWIGGCGEVTIGANTMIGIGTVIVSSDHDYMNIATPYYDGSEIPKPITIGKNVWIGSSCVVLGGSMIGAGSVVAAGSVVNGEFPENSLIVGVPGVLKSIILRNHPTEVSDGKH